MTIGNPNPTLKQRLARLRPSAAPSNQDESFEEQPLSNNHDKDDHNHKNGARISTGRLNEKIMENFIFPNEFYYCFSANQTIYHYR